MYLFLSIAAIVSIFPFLWMVVSSTNQSVDVTRGRLLPGTHLLENLRKLLDTTDLQLSLMNSAKISITTTLLALLIASLAGYGFEVFRSRSKDIVFNILLLSMMIPFAALMIPLYRMFGQISNVFPWMGIDTMTSVILPTVTTAFLIFFFRQSTKMFPKELLEAGRMDGLSELGIFLRIYLPTMKTTYAAGAIITFMSSLEQLSLAADRIADSADQDHAAAHLHSRLGLRPGLRDDYDRDCDWYDPDGAGVLCDAEAVCGWDDWVGEVR